MSGATLPDLDPLVHEPARLRILAVLALVERADFMFLLRQAALTRGNLSVQAGKLEAAGLVATEKDLAGNRPRTTYSLTAAGRAALGRYRKAMLEILSAFPAPRD